MPKIVIDKIPQEESQAMARCLLVAMTEFYTNPENQKKFEEWKQKQKTA